MAQLSIGNLLTQRRSFEAAVNHYRSAIAADPSLSPAHFNLAGSLVRLGRHDEAAQHYLRVIELEPTNTAALFYLAEAELALQRSAEAAERFAKVVEMEPNRELARLGEATALGRLGKYREQLARLEEGLAALPRSARLAQALARVLAAGPATELRDGPRALELALALYNSQPGAESAETVAMALAQTDRYAEAVQWQRRLISDLEPLDNSEIARRLERNLSLYEAGKPCCALEVPPN